VPREDSVLFLISSRADPFHAMTSEGEATERWAAPITAAARCSQKKT
jgi:hypothetical protein